MCRSLRNRSDRGARFRTFTEVAKLAEGCSWDMQKIWQRAVIPVAVVSVIWLIASIATSAYLTWLDSEQNRVLAENVGSIRAAHEMEAAAWRMHSLAVECAKDRRPASESDVADLENEFETSLRRAKSAALDPREGPLVEAIRVAFENYRRQWRSICLSPHLGDIEVPQLLAELSLITGPCDELMELNEQLMESATRQRSNWTQWVAIGRLVTIVVGPTIGIVLGFRLARQLRQSMTQLSVKLHDVAGELWEEVGVFELQPELDMPEIQKQVEVISARIHGVVEELRATRREAVRSERLAAVGELAAGVAHELRNPLTSLKLLLQTAEHRQGQSLAPRALQVMLEETLRMESTIQGLLDFARPRELRRTKHDLRQTVQRAINLTEGRGKQQQVRMVPQFSATIVLVEADAELLHQVCVNLLLNGIESMAAGGVITIKVESDLAAQVARVSFNDSGSGIPADMLPRLFEPFATSKDHGTGLGLAVSRRIILEHAGKLLACNRDEGGATFTIELPLTVAVN